MQLPAERKVRSNSGLYACNIRRWPSLPSSLASLKCWARRTAERLPCQDFGTGFRQHRANISGCVAISPSVCKQAAISEVSFQSLAAKKKRLDNCTAPTRSLPPMWIHESDRYVHRNWNWIAIFSYAASLVVSLAIWTGVFRAVEHLVK